MRVLCFRSGAGLTASLSLWSQILTGFVIPQVPKMPHKDRSGRVDEDVDRELRDALGACLSKLVCPSISCLVLLWHSPACIGRQLSRPSSSCLAKPQDLASKEDDASGGTGLAEIDYEEQAAGYQAAHSRVGGIGESTRRPIGERLTRKHSAANRQALWDVAFWRRAPGVSIDGFTS